MTQRSETGKLGENLACEYLKGNNYAIITRNYWKPWGEIDIIARDIGGTLVFVEVKTTRSRHSKEVRENNSSIDELTPEDQMTSAKLKKLKKTAQIFSSRRHDLIKNNAGWQIDLVAVILHGGDKPELKHYKNI